MTRASAAATEHSGTSADSNLRLRRLLVGAAIFHLLVTLTVYGLGRYAVLPGTFDTNGIAVSFASDGIKLQKEATTLSDTLARGQVRDWLVANSPFHIKLYSICFVLLRPLFGPTILSAEPLNALWYLAILSLVFHLARTAFNRRAGLIAAAIVGLWPSFLLHTTQLLKDPLFLVGMLGFVLVNLRFLYRNFSWSRALLTGVGGGLIATFIWLARDSMGQLPIAIAALGVTLLIARQFQEKHFHAANLVGMALLIVLSVGVTRVIPKFRKPDADRVEAAHKLPQEPSLAPWSPIAARVVKVRRDFVLTYPDSSSNIDSNVQLTSTADIVRYLPRAAAIGFLAPFPNMWLATGVQVGSSGRMLSGLETIAMYVIEGLALVGVWNGRRRFSVWLICAVAVMGMVALGLVVVNVGALYRLRYVFLILLIVLASEGATRALDWRTRRRSEGGRPAADV